MVTGSLALQRLPRDTVAGVGHLIYSSVADANKKTGIPHFESKYLVEKHVAGLGIPYTISAPVAFMENIVAPCSIGALRQGTYAFAMPPKRVLQLVALTDIGAFVAVLVERREQVFGKRSDFAGDELSGEEQAKILTHAIGRPISYQEIPIATARQQITFLIKLNNKLWLPGNVGELFCARARGHNA
jgi:uncharacterized protein YbjT (DUF2867 family)